MNTYALHAPDRDGRPSRSPSDRQAAVYSITASLQALDLRQWSWTIMDWLALYDGFEQYVPPEHDPAIAVARVFASLARQPPSQRVGPADVVFNIAKQPFMCWHAQWVDASGDSVGGPWRPLEHSPGQAFWAYLGTKPEGGHQIRTQRLPMPHVDLAQHSNWLMAGWLRFSMGRA